MALDGGPTSTLDRHQVSAGEPAVGDHRTRGRRRQRRRRPAATHWLRRRPPPTLRRVDAQALDPEPPDAVADDVDGHQPPRAQRTAAVDPEQQPAQARGSTATRRGTSGGTWCPAGTRAARWSSSISQRPRQVGRRAEQLLVEPVAPPPDRLGQRRAPGRRTCAASAAETPRRWATQMPTRIAGEQAAGDAEAALPDLDDVAEVAVEALPVGDDVVQPGADRRRRAPPTRRSGRRRRACRARAPPAGGRTARPRRRRRGRSSGRRRGATSGPMWSALLDGLGIDWPGTSPPRGRAQPPQSTAPGELDRRGEDVVAVVVLGRHVVAALEPAVVDGPP